MDVTSIALSGLRASSQELRASANNIANATTPGYKAEAVVRRAQDTGGVTTDAVKTDQDVSLEQNLVNADIATYGFQANLKVLQKQQEMDKSLLDIQV